MRWRAVVIALLGCLLGVPPARCQQPAEPSTEPARVGEAQSAPGNRPAAGPRVEVSRLDTYLLRDSKGNLVPVLDLPFEEFERLLRIKRGLAPPLPPSYSLDTVSITGSVQAGIADLQVVASIRVRDSGWVRVPLDLGKAVLRQPARYEGPGEHLLVHEEEAGYVCWLKEPGDKPHLITLQVSVPVTQVTGSSRLAIHVPTATEATMRLTVPGSRVEASLKAGEGIVSSNPQGDRTELAVLGLSGDIELVWQPGREPVAAAAAPLESTGEILVKIEGENRVSSDARLRVRSFGSSIESFRVRLPPEMELVPTPATGYAVAIVPSSTDAMQTGQPPAQVVEVKLDRPATGVVEVRLLAALAAAAGGQSQVQPARFEVLGAVRQRGTIDFSTEGEWLLQWKEDPTARRLDINPDPAAAKFVARYEYSRQPCGLQVAVSTRPSQISVEPTYLLYVEARQVRLEATLRYRLRGARAESLRFDLGNWQFARVTPGELFEIVPADREAKSLVVPFRSGTALPAELDLKLEAQLPTDPSQEGLSFPLPRPIADVVTPASVVVVPADNVELDPLSEQIAGLTLDTSPAPIRVPARQQSPLVYRELNSDQPATFAAKVRVRTGWTTVGARATVALDKQQANVEQRLEYRIAYEPRRSFEILVPRAVQQLGRFEVWNGAEALTATPVSESRTTEGGASRFQVQTAAEQIGLCQLIIKYSLPLPAWDRKKSNTLDLPLVVPADEPHQQIGGQQIAFVSAEGWLLEPDPAGSDEFSRPTPIAGQSDAYSWSRATSLSRWVLVSQEESLANVQVSKAWIQSCLGPGDRQDRAVFRIATDQPHVRIALPRGGSPLSAQAAVNGQVALTAAREPASLLVHLPASARGRECTVEVWYAVSSGADATPDWQTSIAPATVQEATLPRRMYWQLCLPPNQHLVLPPADVAAEMRWSTATWPPRQLPLLQQEQLESWIGASRQDPLPSGLNTYLFSSLGRAPSLQFLALGRRELLAIGSSLTLGIGLLLIHVRWARRPEALLVLGLATAGLALFFPELALLGAQAATLGLIVALGAAGWLWISAGRLAWQSPPAMAIPPRTGEGRSTETPLARMERAPGLTTATAPAGSIAAESQP